MLLNIKSVITVLCVLASANGSVITNENCIKLFSDGCSAPRGLMGKDTFYADKTFLPACDKHDICYSCGRAHGWSQSECDKAFYESMKAICYREYPSKRFISWIMKAATLVGSVIKGKMMKKHSEERCLQAAKIFYRGVSLLGGSPYKKANLQFDPNCNLPCAIALGSPENIIEI